MPGIDADLTDLAPVETIENEAALATDFSDQEPIEGSLTIVDLTASTCRWPSGNPCDLKTFRYCGDTAHSGPYCERHARLAYLPRAA
jgi:GcrA cell cycle regulator